MKPSHLTTPRTMQDGVWIPSHNPGQKYPPVRGHWLPEVYAWVLVFGAIGMVIWKMYQ